MDPLDKRPTTPLPSKTPPPSPVHENHSSFSENGPHNEKEDKKWSVSLDTPLQRPEILNTKEVLHKCHSDPIKTSPVSPVNQKPWTKQSLQKRKGSPVSRCTLNLDGYSYVIVASPPEKCSEIKEAYSPNAESSSKNGQLSKQGSLTILRRSSSKCLSGRNSRAAYVDDEYLDTVDLEEGLPSITSPEATEKAALRLRVLLRKIGQGELSATDLQKNLKYAVEVLETTFFDDTRRQGDDEDELSEVEPDAVPPEVREWLASTFTKQLQSGRRKNDEKPKFRSVANAIRAGIFVERMYRKLSPLTSLTLPADVARLLKRVDDWNFDVWALNETSSNSPIRCLGYELLNRYGLLHKFKIPPLSLESFLTQIETGYCRNKNPYHNNVHASDVLQTIHFMLYKIGLMHWLSDVEMLATLVAAIIHDYEHSGTTNNFHVQSGTETALCYNDRAVLENFHIYEAFKLFKFEEHNILVNLSREEYREFRSLTIDMVLATDMSSHFQQIKSMKSLLALSDSTLDKSKALSLVLHCCDISHPSKEWSIHERWTNHLLEEFFRQGDLEHELGLPYSPLCDRNNTVVAESQIGFIEFIVEPSMQVCGDLLEKISLLISPVNQTIDEDGKESKNTASKRPVKPIQRPWEDHLSINKSKWKERSIREFKEKAASREAENE